MADLEEIFCMRQWLSPPQRASISYELPTVGKVCCLWLLCCDCHTLCVVSVCVLAGYALDVCTTFTMFITYQKEIYDWIGEMQLQRGIVKFLYLYIYWPGECATDYVYVLHSELIIAGMLNVTQVINDSNHIS